MTIVSQASYLSGFGERAPDERNMLWMLFVDDRLNSRIVERPVQAPQVLASFRRDFAQAAEDDRMIALVEDLERISPSFKRLWGQHDVHGRCEGRRSSMIEGRGPVAFDHSSFIVDEEKHLRLVFYAELEAPT